MTDKLIMNKQTNSDEIKVLIIQEQYLFSNDTYISLELTSNLWTVYSKCLQFVTPSPFKNG